MHFRALSITNSYALGLGPQSLGLAEVHISAARQQICALRAPTNANINALGLVLNSEGLR